MRPGQAFLAVRRWKKSETISRKMRKSCRRGKRLLQFPDEGLLVGELAHRFLGVDELAVHLDLEDSAPAGDELEVLDARTVRVQQPGRQTDGLGSVISHHAEGDRDIHDVLLSTVPA